MAEKEVKGIKKFFEEFKAFAMRGNVLDMAVGVVIGGAFTAIVNSLVNDIINPAIGLFFNADFSDVGIHVGDVMIGIGSFINAIINFLIVAFVLFVVIKTINALHKKPAEPEAPAEPTTKVCPYCQSEISIKAVRCPPLHQQAGGLPGDQQLNFEWPPLCSGHIQRNHFLNYKSGKSADFPDLFFTRRAAKANSIINAKPPCPAAVAAVPEQGGFTLSGKMWKISLVKLYLTLVRSASLWKISVLSNTPPNFSAPTPLA